MLRNTLHLGFSLAERARHTGNVNRSPLPWPGVHFMIERRLERRDTVAAYFDSMEGRLENGRIKEFLARNGVNLLHGRNNLVGIGDEEHLWCSNYGVTPAMIEKIGKFDALIEVTFEEGSDEPRFEMLSFGPPPRFVGTIE